MGKTLLKILKITSKCIFWIALTAIAFLIGTIKFANSKK